MELIKNDLQELVLKKQNDLIKLILNKEQEIFELKKQEEKISIQRKYIEKQLEEFKEDVKNIFKENGIEKIETEQGNISIKRNPISVEVIDMNIIPDEYKTIKQIVSVDKKKIADNFKSTGEIIDGVQINTNNTRLEVK